MKIVVLDGYTLNPGDLSWQELEALGDVTLYDRTPADLILYRSEPAEILLTNKTPLTKETIQSLPRLKYIGVLATGYNVVDVKAAADRNIPVTNIPTYGTNSVAQMVFSHILNLCHNVGDHARSVNAGKWAESPDFCFWDRPLIELDGKVLGLIGLGRIGLATARIGQAFGMKVLANDVDPSKVPDGIDFVDLDRIFRESDIVSLHCPLTEDNHKLVNAERLAKMKKSAFLINTSRGPLVDEEALANALNSGQIAGAGLDVLAVEPPVRDHPLYSAKNCYITPHIAWATREARERLYETAVENIKSFLAGRPENVVNR